MKLKGKHGGRRPGAGRPRKVRAPKISEAIAAVSEAAVDDPTEVVSEARKHIRLAVRVLASIARESEVENARVAAAKALLAFASPTAQSEPGKKEQRQASAEKSASVGRFAVPSGPKLVVDNRG